jgi:hypothetical protein
MTTAAQPTIETIHAVARRYSELLAVEKRKVASLPDGPDEAWDRHGSAWAAVCEAGWELVELLRAAGLRGVACDGLLYLDASSDLLDGLLEHRVGTDEGELERMVLVVPADRIAGII